MNIAKKTSLIIIIIISNSLNSQFSIQITDDLLTYYDIRSNSINILKKDSLLSINLDTNSLIRNEFNIDENLGFDYKKELIHVELNGDNYFLQNGNGRVYKIEENRLKRIDDSSISNAFFDSSIFTYDEKIYRFGGYGYWTIYDRLIYFDFITQEWEIVQTDNYPKYGTLSSLSYQFKNKVYFIGGKKFKKYSPNDQLSSNLIMSFDLIKNKWGTNYKFNGELELKKIVEKESEVLVITSKPGIDYRAIKSLNFMENRQYIYKTSPFLPSIDLSKDFFQAKGNLIFYNNKNELNIIPINYLITGKEYIGKILTNNNLPYLILLGLTLIPIIIYLRLIYSRNQEKLLLNKNGILMNNRFAELDDLSIKLLNNIQSKNELSTIEFNDLIFNDDLSRASNYSRKNRILENINNKFKLVSGCNELLINKKKSKDDLRMEIYQLNQKIKIINNI